MPFGDRVNGTAQPSQSQESGPRRRWERDVTGMSASRSACVGLFDLGQEFAVDARLGNLADFELKLS
ncbi:MAG: hypothetical protein ACI9OJ_003860 [Myxococcota bacterium]|jgi:hypothetical protein